MKLIIRLLISAVVIFGVAYLSDGGLLAVEGWQAAGWAALVLGLVNLIVRPVVKLIALPVTCLTLGLFGLVINAAMLYLVAWVVPGLETVGFWQTLLAAVIISLVTSILAKLVEKDD